MIEITFTESAHGGLSLAQTFGKGKYQGGAVGVFIHRKDGSDPTPAEIEETQRRTEAQQRAAWENAIPLGGSSRDVYGFSLGLSFGDISDPLSTDQRISALKIMYSFWNDILEKQENRKLEKIASDLAKVKERIAAGEDSRIWYSDNPDELCGFYWLMDELRHLPDGHGRIYAVKQPEFEEKGNSIITYNGWGEVEPCHFGAFTHLAVPVSDQVRRWYGNQWKQLQAENSLIRACINGRLRSAPESLYDEHIRRELDMQPEEFKEAIVVGSVLGKNQLGISDGYIHQRIDEWVRNGEFVSLTAPDEDEPGYWRMLKKVKREE